MLCGRAAGCLTCFLTNGEHATSAGVRAILENPSHAEAIDFVVDDGEELAELLHALHTDPSGSAANRFLHPRKRWLK